MVKEPLASGSFYHPLKMFWSETQFVIEKIDKHQIREMVLLCFYVNAASIIQAK